MIRFLHLLPIIAVIAAVTAGLKVDGAKGFWREFWRSGGSLLAGYAGLAVVIFLVAHFVGYIP
jgi:hypothetical protein